MVKKMLCSHVIHFKTSTPALSIIQTYLVHWPPPVPVISLQGEHSLTVITREEGYVSPGLGVQTTAR